ncbi:MAG TPA: methylmalonyl-CoA mutase [Candidatus Bathyarchaeota archaeon]|nr:methylmalonyl-CoA mutase [Candidatus Bathyarchaeota archaeon]
MFDERFLSQLERELERWERETVPKWLSRLPERKKEFVTTSGITIKRLYTPLDIAGKDYMQDLGFPGEYPFTRGIHATMYRARIWTMRQFSGYGTAEDTNKRFKYLIKEGETGLSIAFDYPTIMGYDSDHPLARGEVGVCGVAIDTLKDFEILFDGIPMDKVTTSMTINGPTIPILSMYIATAEKQGVPQECLGGTVQNDMLKEFIGQKLIIWPPEPSVKLVVDVIEYCAKHMPRWNPISISGYHIREAGSTAVQELAFTLADGIAYVEKCLERGMNVDDFAPRLSFFFAAHNNFFEEVAKFRAARRMWARIMKERFGAKKPRSMWMRMHVQTSGATLTAQQPVNNVIRVTIQCLAAVLGGAQSIHTNSFDETLCLPTEEAVRVALRTQQIIAYESGVADVVDPLGGSYFVEWLTDEVEERAWRYIDRIDSMGGMVRAIEKGYPQREVASAAYRYQRGVDTGEIPIVGVNCYEVPPEEDWVPIDPAWVVKRAKEYEERQLERLRRVKAERNQAKVEERLDALRRAAEKGENVFPYVLEAVKAYATLGEICGVLREVYGEWKELIVF